MVHPSTPSRRRRRPGEFLAAGALLALMIAGCSSGDDSSSTTSTTSRGTGDLAAACSEVDLAPVETAAADLADAQTTLEAAAGNEAEFASATAVFLDKGSVMFSSLATALDAFFDELAQASGQSAIADVTDDFTTAAADFSALAPEIRAAGTVTSDDIATIQRVGTKFDRFAGYVNAGSPSGDELRRIPECETMIRNLDQATAAISAADGDDEIVID